MAWQTWSKEDVVRETAYGPLRETICIVPPDEEGQVIMDMDIELLERQEGVSTSQVLQYRTYEQVVNDLESVGLDVQSCYSDWSQGPFIASQTKQLMIFLAIKTEERATRFGTY